jgi:hypothetical protein
MASSRFPAAPFLMYVHFHFLRIGRCLVARATAQLAMAFKAGERDATFLHRSDSDHAFRHHGSARSNRCISERPNDRWRNCCWV